jgi:hypothetical protein
MGPINEAQQRVRELFDAHFTVKEIVERTGLEIQIVVRLLNAPRIVRRRHDPPDYKLTEVNPLGLAGD